MVNMKESSPGHMGPPVLPPPQKRCKECQKEKAPSEYRLMRQDKNGKQYFRKACIECENKSRKIEQESKNFAPVNYSEPKLVATIMDLITNDIISSLASALDYFSGQYHDKQTKAKRLKEVALQYELARGYAWVQKKGTKLSWKVHGLGYRKGELIKIAPVINCPSVTLEWIWEVDDIDWEARGIEWTPEEWDKLHMIQEAQSDKP